MPSCCTLRRYSPLGMHFGMLDVYETGLMSQGAKFWTHPTLTLQLPAGTTGAYSGGEGQPDDGICCREGIRSAPQSLVLNQGPLPS